MAGIDIQRLVKRFGPVPVVQELDFRVGDGEFVFFLGPSGCGKTTTLRMIAGLLMPSGGRIEIGGRDVTYLPPQQRNVGMVFQQNVLYQHLDVGDNLAYPLRVRGWPSADVKRRVGEVAERLQIGDVLGRRPNELSAGQAQRVAIGRMLVRQADVFLLDEPISHLDAKLRAYMRTELRHLQKALGVTTLFVSHDQLEAMSMGDRILVMNDGVIQQFDTPQAVFDRPANRFVAGFVGEPHMNIVRAELGAHHGRAAALWPGFAAVLDAAPPGLAAGTAVEIGIRPEHLALAAPREGEALNRAIVEAVEPMGAESLVTVNAGGVTLQARLSCLRLDRLGAGVGDAVALRFDAQRIYVFDAATGVTLQQAGITRARREAA